MGILFKKVSERVFELLKGQSYQVAMYDAYGTRVYDAEEARMFFANPVKMMVNIVESNDDSTIRVNISKQQKIEEIKSLLNNLRLAATHFGLMFTVQMYAKDLKPKDFAFLATKPQVETTATLSNLPKLLEQQTITPDMATWAKMFLKLDTLMKHPIASDTAYLEQAERWTDNRIDESDVILSRILNTIAEQESRQAPWFKGDTKIKLEGIMAMAKKKLNEGGDGNWDAYNSYDDRMVSWEQEWEDFLRGFDAHEFAKFVLDDLIGYTHADQVPGVDKVEVQETLNLSLPDEEAVAKYLSLYISRETDGHIEDAGADLVDSTYAGFAKCGFVIPPMDKSPISELNAFESWVNGFDPTKILETQRVRETVKLKQTKKQIAEMREKIAKAKANKKLMDAKIFRESKDSMFDLAHKLSASQNNPNDLRELVKDLSESQITEVLSVIADIWEPSIAESIKQTMDDVLEIRELTKTRISEARKTNRTVVLSDDEHVSQIRALAGLSKLNESWGVPAAIPAPVEAEPMVPPTQTSAHKQKLLADIQRLMAKLGLTDDSVSITNDDQTSALIYVTWNSLDCRNQAETALSQMGHGVNRDYWVGSNTSELPLGQYQGIDAQVNPMEFSEAIDDKVGVSVYMDSPTMELTDLAHDLAESLGINAQPYYPTLANGLLFKCASDFDASSIIEVLKEKGISAYTSTNEDDDPDGGGSFSDDDLLDLEFDDSEFSFDDDLEDEFDEGRLEIKHFDDDGEETVDIVDESNKPTKLHSTNNGWRIQKKGNDFVVKKGMVSKHFKNTPYAKVLSWTNAARPIADKVDEAEKIIGETDTSNGWRIQKKGNAFIVKKGMVVKRFADTTYDKIVAWTKGLAASRFNTVSEDTPYKPGVTVLVRSLTFNDDLDWEAVKGIKWPYGIQVRFNEATREVTWKTAKMKTVASLLEKNIDFDATSAFDMLELPMELYNSVEEARLLGTYMSKDALARDTDESDAEYIHQQQFKRKWKAENPDKKWPGYSSAGYQHPKYAIKEAPRDLAKGFYLYSTIGSDQADPVLPAYGSFKTLFAANDRISQMDEEEEDGVAVCYFDGENFRPTKGNKIQRCDLAGDKLGPLAKQIDEISSNLAWEYINKAEPENEKRYGELDYMRKRTYNPYDDGENMRHDIATKKVANKLRQRERGIGRAEQKVGYRGNHNGIKIKATETIGDRDPSTTGKSGTEWAPWLEVMHSELEDGGPATLAMIENAAWYVLSEYGEDRHWTKTASRSLDAAVDELVGVYNQNNERFSNSGPSSEVYGESQIDEDWGSSDWSALINSMDREINGKVNPDTIQAAAESAAEFYGEHLGYTRHEDAVDSIIAMYMRRKFRMSAPVSEAAPRRVAPKPVSKRTAANRARSVARNADSVKRAGEFLKATPTEKVATISWVSGPNSLIAISVAANALSLARRLGLGFKGGHDGATEGDLTWKYVVTGPEAEITKFVEWYSRAVKIAERSQPMEPKKQASWRVPNVKSKNI